MATVWTDLFDVTQLWIQPIECVRIWMQTHTKTHISHMTSYVGLPQYSRATPRIISSLPSVLYTNPQVNFIYRSAAFWLCDIVLLIHDQLFLQPLPVPHNEKFLSQIWINSFFANREYITQNTQTVDDVEVFCPMLSDIRKNAVPSGGSEALTVFLLTRLALKWRWLWSIGGMILTGIKVLEGKPVTVQLFSPQISHGLAHDRTRASLPSNNGWDGNQCVTQQLTSKLWH
jgi:hypothetical protein